MTISKKMRFLCFLVLFCLTATNGFSKTPGEALKNLLEGNHRFIRDELRYFDHSSDRKQDLIKKQEPFAVIVCCSDSRVAPEIIFDQALGDLFVVRVAGNVVGPLELDSIDYAIKYLKASMVFVVGHQNCGAVDAVLSGQTADIPDVARLIAPAIKGAKTLEEAVKDNVRSIVAQLKKTTLIKQFIADGKVDCIGAYYPFTTGKIEVLQ